MSLPCDPLILTGALHCLVQNALAAGAAGEKVRVCIAVSMKPSRSPSFERIVVLEVSDDGPGIPVEVAPYIFMDGFSYRPARPTRAIGTVGGGLTVARAQLISCHGDMQLGAGRPVRGTLSAVPATFVMRFGVPHRAVAGPADATAPPVVRGSALPAAGGGRWTASRPVGPGC